MSRYLIMVNDFMKSRYGVDQLTVTLLIVNVAMMVTGQIMRQDVLIYASLLPLLVMYFRIFSKDKKRRSQENQLLMSLLNPLFKEMKTKTEKRSNTYSYYTCKKCKQELRVPKGKGKLVIKCPNCSHEFKKRT